MSDFPKASIRAKGLLSWIRSRPLAFGVGSLIAAGVGTLLWFVVWMAVPRHVNTKVHDISWMHLTHLRERVTKHNSEWYRQSTKGYYQEPVFNQTCETRFHYMHTYICGYITSSCGNNCTSSTPIYCSTPVYDPWCSYDYYDWPVKDTKQILGFDHDLHWGVYDLGPNQRMQMISSYEVNFNGDFQYKPSTPEDFKRFTPGDTWRLTVGRIRRYHIEEMEKL